MSALKKNSKSRRGTPVQAHTRLRRVMLWLSSGSATANSGKTSTAGVSQSITPSSTSVAISIVVSDLPTEPIIMGVSGVIGASPPAPFTPKPPV